MTCIGYLIHTWRSLWSSDYIWEADDPRYSKVFKSICYAITFLLFGVWLIPLRDLCNYFGWHRAKWICNNVPNGITLLVRGGCGAPGVIFLGIAVWQSSNVWLFSPSGWFWFVVLMFCTDFIDGPLARQLHYVTKFGRDADPTIDKVVAGLLAIELSILVFRYQGVPVAIVLTSVQIWLIWVEQDIARISLRARKWSKTTGIAMHGAFGAGKTKYVIESTALGASYSWLVWSPFSSVGTTIATSLLIPARFFAFKSRELHRVEELALRKSYLAGIRAAGIEPVVQMGIDGREAS